MSLKFFQLISFHTKQLATIYCNHPFNQVFFVRLFLQNSKKFMIEHNKNPIVERHRIAADKADTRIDDAQMIAAK